MSGLYWGLVGSCRYSGARRGISGVRGHWGLLEDIGSDGEPLAHIRGVGVSGVYWGLVGSCRYSGARRGISGVRGHWQLLEDVGADGEPLGASGGVGGVRDVLGLVGSVGTQDQKDIGSIRAIGGS